MLLRLEKLNQLTRTLGTYIYCDAIPLNSWRIQDKLAYGTPLPAPDDPGWRSVTPDDLWGKRMSWAWLTAEAAIPAHFAGKAAALHIELQHLLTNPAGNLYTGPEALVTIPGLNTPPQAINSMHHEVLLAEHAQPMPIPIVMECFTGVSQPGDHRVRFNVAELVWIDRAVEGLYWDARVLLDALAVLPEAAPERGLYLRVLEDAFQCINWLNPPDEAFGDSVRQARAILRAQLFGPVATTDNPTVPRPVVHAMGHAHIDVAWLWPLRVTRGKAARTFATALALMEQFPAYTFTQSQPHLYKMVAEDDPALFGRIKARIAEGRWNATGGSWVEMDTNMPSGESLVRQFLHGMRYFQRELGVRPEVLWLPDVFGYSAALPQILRLAGIRYFFTAKLSWNQYTRYPFDTFWWEGLDGSRVLTHLATTPETLWKGAQDYYSTYNGALSAEDMLGTWTRYKQKAANHHVMAAYGMGDGGGGPNRDMVERRARLENLAGLPQVIHSTAEQFFHAVEDTIPDNLPHWVGELYFQLHRGTYTTQSRTKRHNRKSEVLLHDAEALAAIGHLLKQPYPQEVFHAAWETVLLHQFHDILPGSSIRDVYEDAEHSYTREQHRVTQALDETLAALAQHIRYDEDMQGFAVFNTLSTSIGGPIEVSLPGIGPVEVVGPSGRIRPFQWIDQDTRRALLAPTTIPCYGHKAYIVRPAEHDGTGPVTHPVTATPTRLENNLLRAEFDAQGNLIRLYDLENYRDVLAPDTIGNQLWAYIDRPHNWDAWEVEPYAQDQGWRLEPESVRLVEAGPVRATLEVVYRFNRSTVTQHISLLAERRLLTFDTEVDWHERHVLLRTHFPLAVRAMNTTYEVQFGTVERPTHRNTAWDEARFEVPAQQWADLSEGGYGVSLINDCKYGYSTQGSVLTLSLLRSSTEPDPEADQGAHQFSYALYPHAGDWRQGTIMHARRLNHPLRTYPVTGAGTWLPVEFGLLRCQTPGVVVDTVKKAEDSDDLIVRVYEAHGGRVMTTLAFAIPVEAAEEVNLLEESLGPVDVIVDTLRFSLTPYQIRSFRVRLGDVLKTQLG